LFKKIENEKDAVFTLKDAFINNNVKTDSLLTAVFTGFLKVKPLQKNQEKIVIDKELNIKNVFF
jgi:hypothetical protein